MSKSVALAMLGLLVLVATIHGDGFGDTLNKEEGQSSVQSVELNGTITPNRQCWQCSPPCSNAACCEGPHPQCCTDGNYCYCCAA